MTDADAVHLIYCVVEVQEERAFPAGASGAIKRTAAAASTMRVVCHLLYIPNFRSKV